MNFERISIFGVGLIGGSAAAAIRTRWPDCHITGIGRSKKNLDVALQKGLIDEVATADQKLDADLVLVSTPPQATATVLNMISEQQYCGSVTDAASFKGQLAPLADEPSWRGRYIPAHPIAGTENSGAAAAREDLFVGQLVILCPPAGRDPQALSAVTSFWEGLGASTTQMNATTHDQLYAKVSHLPHVLMFALARLLFANLTPQQLAAHTGGGLRGLLRIAASDASMWEEIFLGNREVLLQTLDSFAAELALWREQLATNQIPADLTQTIQAVRSYRRLCHEDS